MERRAESGGAAATTPQFVPLVEARTLCNSILAAQPNEASAER